MSIKPIVFLDLDDTIFQTARKMESTADATPVTFRANGSPASWMRPTQRNFFEWLSHVAEVIPVTGRSLEQLDRVALSFSSWKVACHGAVIMDAQGIVDAAWAKEVRQILDPLQGDMEELREMGESFFASKGIDAFARIERHDGLGLYVVKKHTAWEKLDELYLVQECLKAHPRIDKFRIFANDNNVSVMSAGLDKGKAVRRILDSVGHARPILGFGDSVSDFSYLNVCDWWGTPRRSQIAQSIWGQG
ncbi:MAG: hypothetical protein IJU37_12535 [Desulfovibrio sp.]|nr:hypothetical protein [Desulfovibrio sp.]